MLLGPEAKDAREVARAVHDEGGEPRLLRADPLAQRAQHEPGHHVAMAVEDGCGEARAAPRGLVDGDRESPPPDLVELPAKGPPRDGRLWRARLRPASL